MLASGSQLLVPDIFRIIINSPAKIVPAAGDTLSGELCEPRRTSHKVTSERREFEPRDPGAAPRFFILQGSPLLNEVHLIALQKPYQEHLLEDI